jgi:hypothetical protein
MVQGFKVSRFQGFKPQGFWFRCSGLYALLMVGAAASPP